MSTRNEVLNNLATLLSGVSGIKTVVVANEPLDLQQYAVAELPLIEIRVESESVDYETGRVGYWHLTMAVTVYFLATQNDDSGRETLNEGIKNKIGSDPTLSEICEMCEIVSENSEGAFPLYSERFGVVASYERGIANA